jgi:hypothetical protein
MIELSAEQIFVLNDNASAAPRVVNPQTKEEFVLIRREVYERLRGLLDEDFSAEDAFRAQIEAAASAGWDDAALDIYNDIEAQHS